MTEELRRKHIETLEVLQEFQDENDALKSKLAGSAASEVEALRASLASATSGREAAEAKAEAAAASAKEAAKKQRSAENGLRTERSLRAAETAEAEAAAAASADAIRRLENERDDAVHTAAARADADAKQVAALEAKAAELARELEKARVVAAAYKAANEQDINFGMLSSTVKQYNAKPVLVVKNANYIKNEEKGFVEIGCNLGGFSYLARQGMYNCMSYVPQIDFRIGFVVEGESDEELPERMMCAVEVHMADIAKLAEI